VAVDVPEAVATEEDTELAYPTTVELPTAVPTEANV
jgi:hypothetical protein